MLRLQVLGSIRRRGYRDMQHHSQIKADLPVSYSPTSFTEDSNVRGVSERTTRFFVYRLALQSAFGEHQGLLRLAPRAFHPQGRLVFLGGWVG